jgi:hypothetical protein
MLAQGTAQLTGRITDATAAVVPAAAVSVINTGTGAKRNLESNDTGYYTAALLPPGSYQITVQKQGFRPITRTGIRLEVDQAARVDFVLDVGTLTEAVSIEANISTVDTQTSTLKSVVDERRIRELPLNGRDATQLVLLLPGVYTTNDTNGLRNGGSGRGLVQPGFASNGARSNMVNYALDGAFHNDTYTNVALAMPNPDALQEFSVQTNNFGAEHGRSAGAIVNAVTRSGTNQLRGSLFWFHRNYAANARNFFATGNDGLKRNQFGATVGGPAYIPKVYNGRDKTFFLFSMQETYQVQTPADRNTVVLTAAQRQGDFSARSQAILDPTTRLPFPGNRIPMSRLNPVSANVINTLIPLPTEASGIYRFSVPNTSDSRQIVTKIDHHFNERDTLSGRYLYNGFSQPANDVPDVFATLGRTTTPNHNLSLTHTHIFGPSALNSLLFSLNRRVSTTDPVWNVDWQDLGMKNVTGARPVKPFALNINGAFSVELGERATTEPNAYTISDTFRKTAGRHEISLGFEYRHQTLHKNYTWLRSPAIVMAGDFSGYGVSDFFLGLPSRLQQTAYGELGDQSFPNYIGFAQDNIRVSPSLTVNVGVRFEPFVPYVDAGNRTSVFRPGAKTQVFTNAPAGLLFVGDPNVPRAGTKSDLNNWAPRLGFAWTPFGNNRTSIRGAYGIFYDSSPMAAITNVFQTVAPFGTRVTLQPPPGDLTDPYQGANPFPLPYPPPKDIAFPTNLTVATWPDRFRAAYLQSWHLTVERQLKSDWVMRVAYAASKGTALLQGYERNPAIYTPGSSTTANTLARKPFAPAFQNITEVSSSGNSNFHSLQVTLDKRFARNFSVLASYTWAKSIDYGSGAGTLWPSYSNPFNFAHERGVSDFHRAHRLVVSGLWELPRLAAQPPVVHHLIGGWSLSGVVSLQTGPYYSIRSGTDRSLSGVNLDRADLAGDWRQSARQDPNRDPVLEWFNTRAFAPAREGTFGSSGRNVVLGPGMSNVDMAFAKEIPTYKETRIQLRLEAFNLFNHTNLIAPRSDTITSGTYGRMTSAMDPRILQFGVKWRF